MTGCPSYRLGCTCGQCQRRYYAEHAHSCTYAAQVVACYCGTNYAGIVCPGCGRAVSKPWTAATTTP